MPKLAAGRDRPTRAAIYTRVSTDRQAEEGFSLDEQQRRGLAHIDRLGWQHAGTYREEGVSGAERHRPQLDRLLGSLDDVDAVIVPSLDRLGRSTRNLLELYDLFEDRGVALVSLRDNVDTSTPMGRMMRTVLSAVAEFERPGQGTHERRDRVAYPHDRESLGNAALPVSQARRRPLGARPCGSPDRVADLPRAR